jgi:hypothetical protein
MDLREIGCEDERCTAHDHIQWWASVIAVLPLDSAIAVHL